MWNANLKDSENDQEPKMATTEEKSVKVPVAADEDEDESGARGIDTDSDDEKSVSSSDSEQTTAQHLAEKLDKLFIASGFKQRLGGELLFKLINKGWPEQVKNLFVDYVRKNCKDGDTLDTTKMMDSIWPQARALFPKDLEEKMFEDIQKESKKEFEMMERSDGKSSSLGPTGKDFPTPYPRDAAAKDDTDSTSSSDYSEDETRSLSTEEDSDSGQTTEAEPITSSSSSSRSSLSSSENEDKVDLSTKLPTEEKEDKSTSLPTPKTSDQGTPLASEDDDDIPAPAYSPISSIGVSAEEREMEMGSPLPSPDITVLPHFNRKKTPVSLPTKTKLREVSRVLMFDGQTYGRNEPDMDKAEDKSEAPSGSQSEIFPRTLIFATKADGEINPEMDKMKDASNASSASYSQLLTDAEMLETKCQVQEEAGASGSQLAVLLQDLLFESEKKPKKEIMDSPIKAKLEFKPAVLPSSLMTETETVKELEPELGKEEYPQRPHH